MTNKTIRAAEPSEAAGTGVPIDLAHLARQAMGDPAIEAEVLAIFAREAGVLGTEIAAVSGDERRRLAHRLKGSARGVGAFAVATSAEEVEADPDDDALVRGLKLHIDDALAFLAALGRGTAAAGRS